MLLIAIYLFETSSDNRDIFFEMYIVHDFDTYALKSLNVCDIFLHIY